MANARILKLAGPLQAIEENLYSGKKVTKVHFVSVFCPFCVRFEKKSAKFLLVLMSNQYSKRRILNAIAMGWVAKVLFVKITSSLILMEMTLDWAGKVFLTVSRKARIRFLMRKNRQFAYKPWCPGQQFRLKK